MAKECFECGGVANHDHHVVPKSLGGTKTIPLCVECHSKVHGRALTHSSLVKAGIERAKAEGRPVGGGSKKGRIIALTPAQVRKARRMHSKGEGVSEIARVLGVSRPTIYRVIPAANGFYVEARA
jgi:hypothetical protein